MTTHATSDVSEFQDIVLVLRRDGVLLPVYEQALQLAEGWPWAIKRAYADALLIRSAGTVSKVERLTIDRPYGKSFLARLFSVLNSNWVVVLHIAPSVLAPEQLAQAVSRGLELDGSSGRALFEGRTASPAKDRELVQELFRSFGQTGSEFVALDSL